MTPSLVLFVEGRHDVTLTLQSLSQPQLGDIQHPDLHGTLGLEQVGGRKVQQELGQDRQEDIGVLMTLPQEAGIGALLMDGGIEALA